jgi:GNAT superfamily N-acetyltransferase
VTIRGWGRFARAIADPSMLPVLAGKIATRLWSRETAICLDAETARVRPIPSARIALEIRPMVRADLEALAREVAGTTARERWEVATRLRLFDAGLGSPLVALTADGRVVHTQWLFLPPDNAGLQAYFGGAFAALRDGEALLEGLYTPPAWRGLGIMPAATVLSTLEARARGAARAIIVVAIDNLPSLKGCAKAGYTPCRLRLQRWTMLRRTVRFVPLPAELAVPSDAILGRPSSDDPGRRPVAAGPAGRGERGLAGP